jgi:tetratricopeptide (TPR) repeat protein/predicted Ser/Thr protein kinase
MVRCPTELELEKFLEGCGSGEERGQIEQHQTTCETCRAWLLEARADEEVVPDLQRVHADSTSSRPAAEVEGLDAEPALARYRILRRLGAGGMGVVYEAEQRNPRRRVALKVLRSGGFSERSLKRFEHEAQVLGRLEHPGIGKILEAGTFESHGQPQPFFAMELVDGASLIRWADDQSLALRPRLRLFLRVCDAVQHAHQKGVVHRDLKPANILVTAAGEPKVLDFGVARTFDVDVQVTSIRSEAGEIVGTLPYMSPEQLAGDPLEIDTRSDVYALGVLLYELLAGRLPYRATGRTVPEAIKLMETTEPDPLGSVRGELAGDLETIARKALEKDKGLRYPSAEALADDVNHYLRHEPIDARPPSAIYHLRKFARRNRAVVTALALTITALVAGIATTSWQALRARGAERDATDQALRARSAERDATDQATRARAAEAEARSEAAAVEELNDFLQALIGFDQDDPLGALRGGDTTLREIVEDAEQRLDEAPLEDRRSEAKIRIAIGNFWRRLEEGVRSARNLERSLELRREIFPPTHLKIAEVLNTVGVSRYGRGDVESAEECWREALDIYDVLDDPAHAPKVATTIGNLSSCALARGDAEEAEGLLLRARAMHTESLGPHNLHVAADVKQLADLKQRSGEIDEAIALLEESIEIAELAGEADHPHAIPSLAALGNIYLDRGRLADAEKLMRLAVERTTRTLGDDHPDTAHQKHNLAAVLRERNRPAEAGVLAAEAVAVYRRYPEHIDQLAHVIDLQGALLNYLGEYEQALEYLYEAEDLHGRVHPGNAIIATTRASIGRALLKLERHDEAVPFLRRAVEALRRVPSSHLRQSARASLDLGAALYLQGELPAAERSLREGLEKLAGVRDRFGVRYEPPRLARHVDLALIVADQGRAAEAERIIELALDESMELLGPQHSATGSLLLGLARRLEARGDLVGAESMLRELLSNRVSAGSKDDIGVLNIGARLELADVLRRLGREGQVAAITDEALALADELHATDPSARAHAYASAANVLRELGRLPRAEELARSAVETLGLEHPNGVHSANSFVAHGRTLISLERYDAAEDVLLRCLTGVEAMSGDRGELVQKVIGLLVDAYEGSGQHEAAAEYRARQVVSGVGSE